ncbi:MAG: hypothetical protein ACOYMZ_00480 [Minisyncoccia bacterium]
MRKLIIVLMISNLLVVTQCLTGLAHARPKKQQTGDMSTDHGTITQTLLTVNVSLYSTLDVYNIYEITALSATSVVYAQKECSSARKIIKQVIYPRCNSPS